jgi:hypothetical protein
VSGGIATHAPYLLILSAHQAGYSDTYGEYTGCSCGERVWWGRDHSPVGQRIAFANHQLAALAARGFTVAPS